jgi:hypothetical protein
MRTTLLGMHSTLLGMHSKVRFGLTMLLGLKPGHACDPMACLSRDHILSPVFRKLCRNTEGALQMRDLSLTMNSCHTPLNGLKAR